MLGISELQRTRQIVVGLLLLCFLLYFWELGQIPFYNYEESKEALVVWEIVNNGGWILPLRNGTEIPLKPPLFHWCGALMALLSGRLNEFAVRSPSAVFATATVLVTFFFGQALWHWRVGLLSALILATSPEWVRWATYARSDMALVFFLTAACVTFFHLWQESAVRRRTVYLFYLSVGLATLAKGPLGLIVPGLVVVFFLGIARELRFFSRMRLTEGAVIVFLVAASWYLLALWQGGGEFFRHQILDENVFRFLDNEQGGPSRDHAFYYYVPALCAGMLPWSLFFPALAHFLYSSRAELSERKLRYPLVWGLTGLVFFSLASGKRSNYILPLYPAVALLLGVWWQELVSQFPVVVVWLAILALATAWYDWGLRREQWMYVFAALTVCTSSSLYFTNALFHPLLAWERTYKPFMRGVRSTVKNAPLYFYKDAYDYGAIFYADRHIPSYKDDLPSLPVDSNAGTPLYLLMWEEDWQTLSATTANRLEYLVTSEGKGPDKKHRLVLVALLPGHDRDDGKEQGKQ